MFRSLYGLQSTADDRVDIDSEMLYEIKSYTRIDFIFNLIMSIYYDKQEFLIELVKLKQ